MRRPWLVGLWATIAIFFLVSFGAATSKSDDPPSAVDTPTETTFNGQTVPPLEALTGANFRDRIKDGYW